MHPVRENTKKRTTKRRARDTGMISPYHAKIEKKNEPEHLPLCSCFCCYLVHVAYRHRKRAEPVHHRSLGVTTRFTTSRTDTHTLTEKNTNISLSFSAPASAAISCTWRIGTVREPSRFTTGRRGVTTRFTTSRTDTETNTNAHHLVTQPPQAQTPTGTDISFARSPPPPNRNQP
jgi:hypothetical protein